MGGTILRVDGFLSTGCILVFDECNTTGSAILHNELALGHGAKFTEDQHLAHVHRDELFIHFLLLNK
jgi:hypothetical protein